MYSPSEQLPRGVGQGRGKIILTGEHAVVYGQPAIAIPVTEVITTASVKAGNDEGVIIFANDLPAVFSLANDDNGITQIIRLCLESIAVQSPRLIIRVNSTIPIASGFGSGAALSAAIARALFSYFGEQLPAEVLNSLVFEVEKNYHLTPSGIDNTVISYEKPVYFIKGQSTKQIHASADFQFLIGFTGKSSLTKIAVKEVRDAWLADPERYNCFFQMIGEISMNARQALETGDKPLLGSLMNNNQVLLREMNLSSSELEVLIQAASDAGALGAKLSGGGKGGNMIALVDEFVVKDVRASMIRAGAAAIYETNIKGSN